VSALLTGLPAAIPSNARLLILGSMPGAESLRRGEYYAHPRNLFWDVIEAAYAIPRALPYAERLARLGRCRIALWDVAARCRRPGSLDVAIETASVEPNDFAALFDAHPALINVCFNGQKAAALFRKLVLPRLGPAQARLAYHALPSTSPANASLPVADKRRRWIAVLAPGPAKPADDTAATAGRAR
jgi:hypoxanthine-DNA glycosylase